MLSGHRDWPCREVSIPKPLSARDALEPWISRRLPSTTCLLRTHLAVVQLGLPFPGVLGGSLGRGRRGPTGWGLQAPEVQNRCPPGLVRGISRGWLGPREHLGLPEKQDGLLGGTWQARGSTDQYLDPHHLRGLHSCPKSPKLETDQATQRSLAMVMTGLCAVWGWPAETSKLGGLLRHCRPRSLRPPWQSQNPGPAGRGQEAIGQA